MDLIYPYKDFKWYVDAIDKYAKMIDEIREKRRKTGDWEYMKETYEKLWATMTNFEERRDRMHKQVIPEVGAICTVHWFSDRSKAFVEKVLSPKTIQVKCNGLYSCTKIFTYRKNGCWIEKGSTIRDWSTRCTLGYASDYYDLSF